MNEHTKNLPDLTLSDGVNLFDALYKLQVGLGYQLFDPIAQELMQHLTPDQLTKL